MNQYQIAKFATDCFELDVEVSPDEETVWLTKEQMALLFGRDRSVISRHIRNIYSENELKEEGTCAKNARMVHSLNRSYFENIYNLDVIISVGYRVKSNNGILFRKWATNVLKEYLLKGYVLNKDRALVTNENYVNLVNKVNSIDARLSSIEKREINKETIFFDGQMFDAKSFISNIIFKAENSIVLVDPYVDLNTLDYLKNKKSETKLDVYCSSKSKLSKKDVTVFNKQYGLLSVNIIENYHDRFLIIDDVELYHLGTSLNYAGKKVFAITKIESKDILNSIKGSLNHEQK